MKIMNKEEYVFGNIVLRLPDKNGIYVCSPYSATGKTKLGKIFDKLDNQNKPFGYITYHIDINMMLAHLSTLVDDKYKYIFVDRADMYTGYISNILKDLGNNKVVLVDSKNPEFKYDYRCNIYLKSSTEIEVEPCTL